MSRTLLEYALLSALVEPRSAPQAAALATDALGTPILRQVAATALGRLVSDGLVAMMVNKVGRKPVNCYELTAQGKVGFAEFAGISAKILGTVPPTPVSIPATAPIPPPSLPKPTPLNPLPPSPVQTSPIRILLNLPLNIHDGIKTDLTEAVDAIRETKPTDIPDTYDYIEHEVFEVLQLTRADTPEILACSIWTKLDHPIPGTKSKGPAMTAMIGDEMQQQVQAKLLTEEGWFRDPPQ